MGFALLNPSYDRHLRVLCEILCVFCGKEFLLLHSFGTSPLRGYSSQYWRKPCLVASWCGWARSRSTSMSMPSPGAVGRSIQPSLTDSEAVAISSHTPVKLTKYSVMRKLGMTAETCPLASRPISGEVAFRLRHA